MVPSRDRPLETYLPGPGQEEVYNRYIQPFLDTTKKTNGGCVPFMQTFCELPTPCPVVPLLVTMCRMKRSKRLPHDYYLITPALGLDNSLIIILFTKTWYGKKAANIVQDEFLKYC